MNKFLLYFVKVTGYPAMRLLANWKVHFLNESQQWKRIPPGTILMSNHKALLDFPLYLMLFFASPVHFLIAEVIYEKGALMSWFLGKLGSVRVNRTTYDFSFIEESAQLLRKGERIGIFPEGQLPRNGKMSRFTPSCAMIALVSGADIIPVYTDGNYGFGKRANVMVGEKICLRDICSSENPGREEIKMCNELLLSKILELEEELKKRLAAEK